MSAWRDFWCRFSGEKQGSWSMDVIPTFQLGWEMLKRCLGSSLGPWQCLCPKIRQHSGAELSSRTPSSSWLRGSQGSALPFYGVFIWFMDVNSFGVQTCLLTERKGPAEEAVPCCTGGVKAVKRVHLPFYFLSVARIPFHFCVSSLRAVTGVVQLCFLDEISREMHLHKSLVPFSTNT